MQIMKTPFSTSSSLLRSKTRLSPYIFTLFAFILLVTILYGEDFMCTLDQQLQNYSNPDKLFSTTQRVKRKKVPFAVGKTEEGCDIFSGRWVRDELTRPLYEESECPYIQPQLTCQKHGRPDKGYQNWRWQPHGCDLPNKDRGLQITMGLRPNSSIQPNRPNYRIQCEIHGDRPHISQRLGLLHCYKYSTLHSARYTPRAVKAIRSSLILQRPDLRTKQFNSSSVLIRFNASLMLETLHGKRMMFVGDSLNRGQYVSFVCLLHRLIPEDAKSMETFDSLTVFTAKEYNATIEFYWAPFLLESNADNAIVHRISDRVVRKGSINKHGRNWKGVDILVFNTYLWWMTGLKMKILLGSFDDEVKEIVEVSTEDAYRMAMKSMLRWVRLNMDPKKTRVFFTSMSPSHGKSIDWGDEQGGNCYNQTTLIDDPTYWGSDCRKSIMQVIGEVLSKTKVPITFLNITQLSSYRRDAHTSIYKKQWSPLTPEQLANPVSYADCVHWCLPGLQDTWNELLFAKLFYP